ncbi:MFS transporter [Amycolatopsis rhizosphaerae]|uniref:MFS transporter n=1 Tax=Amycolatopsis rhizosphaerae TaxID=2053003 RepID=A0A558AWD1_9PSEU|nr:MFS transporter [Amycolatopsis rhizosphaerae]TVT28575.1 MFS transporter [Amycolatopsis rhizosphaerae]
MRERLTLLSGLALLSGTAFLFAERHERAMLPLGLLRRGRLPMSAAVALRMTYGALLLPSLQLQHRPGTSALLDGVELLPLPVLVMVTSPLAGSLVTRFGPRPAMTAGMGGPVVVIGRCCGCWAWF